MEQGSGVSTENFTLDPSYQMDGSNYMLRTKRVDTTSYNELQTSISIFLLSIYSTAQACPPAKNYMSPCLLTKNPVESRHPASASTERGF